MSVDRYQSWEDLLVEEDAAPASDAPSISIDPASAPELAALLAERERLAARLAALSASGPQPDARDARSQACFPLPKYDPERRRADRRAREQEDRQVAAARRQTALELLARKREIEREIELERDAEARLVARLAQRRAEEVARAAASERVFAQARERRCAELRVARLEERRGAWIGSVRDADEREPLSPRRGMRVDERSPRRRIED